MATADDEIGKHQLYARGETNRRRQDYRSWYRVGLAVVYGLYHQQQLWAPAGFLSRGGGKFRDAKSWRPFLVVTLKTQVFTVTTNAQTLYKISRKGEASALKTFHYFRRGRCVCRRGRLCHDTMAQWPVQACHDIQHQGRAFHSHAVYSETMKCFHSFIHSSPEIKKKHMWDQSEKVRKIATRRMYGKGKFWVWGGREKE